MVDLENTKTKTKKRSRILLLLLLVMLVGITSCIVGYILGQRAGIQSGGEIVDTIVITPSDSVITYESTFSLSGVVRYTDGTPAANTAVELHSTPRTTTTDKNGYFFFHLTEAGAHTLYVKDSQGNILASCPVAVTAQQDSTSVNITWSEENGYTVEIPANALLVELEVVLGEGDSLELAAVTVIQNSGIILTPEGAETPEENRTVTTQQGNIVFDDATVLLPDGRVLLRDGTLVSVTGTVTHPDGTQEKSNDVIWTEEKAAVIPGGTVLTPGGHVITNRSDKVHPDGYVELSDGTVVDGTQGQITLPDGTVISTKGDETTLPDGTVIDRENNTVTLPDGTVIDQKENTVTLPDGTEIDQNENTVTLPDGTVIDMEEKTVTLPDGTEIDQEEGTVTPPEDTDDPTAPTDPEGTEPNTPVNPGSVSVTSEGKTWTQNTIINLFAGIDQLYPGTEGSYTFKVSNTRAHAVAFSMTVTDDNTNAIPFVLTLKDSKGNVVSADSIRLAANSSMTYTLHWVWPYESGNDAYDTMLGESADRTHTVTITIHAEETA